MPFQNRMMTLIAFLQAQNCSNLPGSWRHPSTTLDFLTPEYYQRIARTLEDGKIQMAFFDDRLALPDIYTGHHADTVAAGVRAVKMDPSTILMTMGMVTQRLGLGVTYSTTYYEPFHVARLFATMDLMLKGRAAWNIVTSLNRAEAANFGRDEQKCRILRRDQKVASKSKLKPAADCSAPDHCHGGNAQCFNGVERTVALGDERAEPVGALSWPLRDIAPHAEIRAVRPNDEHPAVTQARVMDRRAKVHGELAADAVRRGVRQDNGPDAVILLKPDRRHFQSFLCAKRVSARYRRERASAVGKWGTSAAL
jgi:hypothetical protein